jgi:hypothetical protein
MPLYYERPLQNENRNIKNLADCIKECFNMTDCIQAIYYTDASWNQTLTNGTQFPAALGTTCYLQTRLNISNGIMKSQKSNIYNVKSDASEYTLKSLKGNENKLQIQYITPFGDLFKSDEVLLKQDSIIYLNTSKDENKLTLKLDWSVSNANTITLKRYYIKYRLNGTKDINYFCKFS